jgi:hypothetical protein
MTMAARPTTKEAEGEKPTTRKASTKKATTPKEAASNGPAASAEARSATGPKKRLPAATVRALKELEAGNLNRYADADELFRKLDIKLGEEG